MNRWNPSRVLCLVTIAALFFSCGKPPVAVTPPPKPTSPTASTRPMGHFRLTLQLKQDIEHEENKVGEPIVPLKTYDPVTIAQADFYLPEGPDAEGVAELSSGRRLLLKFVDLKLTPGKATARQYAFDGNFVVQTAAGTYSAWPYALNSLTPGPEFPVGVGVPDTLSEFGFAEKGIMVNSGAISEITYLGETTDADLLKKSMPPALLDPLPPGLKDRIEADARELRAQQPAQ